MSMKAVLLALAATLSLGPVSALAQSTPGWREPSPDNVLVIDTNKGRIIAELTPYTGPQNVARLQELTRRKFYDGLTFFRVISGFMAQTGDPKNNGSGGSDLPDVRAEFTFKRGADLKFTRITDYGPKVGFIGPMVVESQSDALMAMTVDGRVSAQPRFCKGVIGIARAGSPDSANSQFFLMRDTRPDLDGEYTVAGRVLKGLEVVQAIKTGEPVADPQDRMTTVRLLSDLPAAERPRVLVRDTTSPEFVAWARQQKAAKGASFDICDLDIEASVQ